MTPAPRPGAVIRKVGFACAVLACIALPALIVGARIDAAPAPGEVERLRAALDGAAASRLAERFLSLTVPAAAGWPDDPAAADRLLATARLAQVLGVLALGMLTYLGTLLARGRLAALCACLGLACLPAVMVQGYVLRPETAATMFTALGLVLLQCLVTAGHDRRPRGPVRRGVVLALPALCAATALGLAVGTVPALGGALQLPLALAGLVALQLLVRGLRVGVRRGFLGVPAHAISGRLWAPALAALLAFVMALLCLHLALRAPDGAVRPTALAVSLLPGNAFAAALLLALAVLGAASFVLRTGARFGRRGRAGADLVLLVYCVTQVGYGLSTNARFDPLPAAPALAVLFGEGLLGITAFAAWLAQRRRGVTARPRR